MPASGISGRFADPTAGAGHRRADGTPDQPASQQGKRDRTADLSGAPPTYVPLDFGQGRLDQALMAAGHRTDQATTWVWEGVAARALAASTGRTTVWANEPWRSTWTPAAMANLLARHETATALATPIRHRRSLSKSRVMVAGRR